VIVGLDKRGSAREKQNLSPMLIEKPEMMDINLSAILLHCGQAMKHLCIIGMSSILAALNWDGGLGETYRLSENEQGSLAKS